MSVDGAHARRGSAGVVEGFLGSSAGGVVCVMGAGAEIVDIVMQGKTRHVKVPLFVWHGNDQTLMKSIGNITKVEQMNMTNNESACWNITYRTFGEAAQALANRHLLSIGIEPVFLTRSRLDSCTVRVTAVRRPVNSKREAFVSFANASDFCEAQSLLCGKRLELRKRFGLREEIKDVHVCETKSKSDRLYIYDLPKWANREVVDAAVAERINGKIKLSAQPRVILPLEPPPTQLQDKKMITSLTDLIESTLWKKNHLDESDFVISSLQPKEKDFTYAVFINFTDVTKAQQTAERLGGVKHERHRITADVDFHLRLFIARSSFERKKDEIQNEIKCLKTEGVVYTHLEELRDGLLVRVKANSLESLWAAQSRLNRCLYGSRVCLNEEQTSELRNLMTKKAKQEVEKKLGVAIRYDSRKDSLFMYGQVPDIINVRYRLEKKLSLDHRKKPMREIKLQRFYPAGIVKSLMMEYGANLEKITDLFPAASITLVVLSQTIRIKSSSEDFLRIRQLVDRISSSLLAEPRNNVIDDLQVCPVCLQAVPLQLRHITSKCRHIYCKECLFLLIENSIRSATIPVRCMAAKCMECVSLQDFRSVNIMVAEQVLPSALRSLLCNKRDSYGCCITPDCPVIFRKPCAEAEQLRKENGGTRIGLATRTHTKQNADLNTAVSNPPHDDTNSNHNHNSYAEVNHILVNNKPVQVEGVEFVCPCCFVSTCKLCEVSYHYGFTCEAYQLHLLSDETS